jgi:bifunctional DNase/RNase
MIIRRIFRRLFARTSDGARSGWPKLVLALLVLGAVPLIGYWRGLGSDPSEIGAGATEMIVENLEQNGQRVNLVLKEKSGPRRVVVSIGQAEALSIIQDLNPSAPMPPMTAYAMSRAMIDKMGGKIQRIVVNNATDKELFAQIVLSTESREMAVDATPSDAIALALRAKAPIFVNAVVLDKVGVVSGR